MLPAICRFNELTGCRAFSRYSNTEALQNGLGLTLLTCEENNHHSNCDTLKLNRALAFWHRLYHRLSEQFLPFFLLFGKPERRSVRKPRLSGKGCQWHSSPQDSWQSVDGWDPLNSKQETWHRNPAGPEWWGFKMLSVPLSLSFHAFSVTPTALSVSQLLQSW